MNNRLKSDTAVPSLPEVNLLEQKSTSDIKSHTQTKIKYRMGLLPLLTKKKLLTPYLIFCRLKTICPSGRYLKGQYTKQMLTFIPKDDAYHDYTKLSRDVQGLIKLGFIKVTDSKDGLIYSFISWIDAWTLIEGPNLSKKLEKEGADLGIRIRDGRRTKNNIEVALQIRKKLNINELPGVAVIHFADKSFPSKEDILLKIQALEISGKVYKQYRVDQQILDPQNGISVKKSAFQEGNDGGFNCSLSKLGKLLGCSSTTAFNVVTKLQKQKYLKKKNRYEIYTPEEIEAVWQDYCFWKYEKYTSVNDWMKDTLSIVNQLYEYDESEVESKSKLLFRSKLDKIKKSSYNDFLKIKEFVASSRQTIVNEVVKSNIEKLDENWLIDKSFQSRAYHFFCLHRIFMNIQDGVELSSLESQQFERCELFNGSMRSQLDSPVFLNDEEFTEFNKTKKSGIFDSAFLSLRSKMRDSQKRSMRMVFKKKQPGIPYRVLANTYYVSEQSSCKVITGYISNPKNPNLSAATFFSPNSNIQKETSLLIPKLEKENFQFPIAAIVM